MGFFGPNIKKLQAQGDVAGLVHCLGFSAGVSRDLGPAALEAIRTIGDTDVLLGLLEAGDPQDRCAAAFALGKLGCQPALEPLIVVLEDTSADPMLRVIASDALASLGDERVVQPLISALGDSDIDVGIASARALGRIGNPQGARPVVNYFIDRVRSFDMKGYLPNRLMIDMLVEQAFSNDVAAISDFGAASVGPLREALDQEDDEKVRLAIENAPRRVDDGRSPVDVSGDPQKLTEEQAVQHCSQCGGAEPGYACQRCERRFCRGCLDRFAVHAATILTQRAFGGAPMTFGSAKTFDDQGRAFCPSCYGDLLDRAVRTGDWNVSSASEIEPSVVPDRPVG
jgi:HEAT repeat protein